MKIKDILENIDFVYENIQKKNIDVLNVMTDSRTESNQSVFFLKQGNFFSGYDFVDQARKNGAVLFIGEKENIEFDDYICVKNITLSQNRVSNLVYDTPSSKIDIIGITGTNGKTSVSYILASLLEFLGKKCGRSGTVDIWDGKKKYPAINTFPEAPLFNTYLRDSIDNKCEYFVCEVSSHALSLGREEGIDINLGIFTNLSRDHMDFHKDFDDYFQSKCKLFQKITKSEKKNKAIVVNADDKYGKKIIKEFKDDIDVLTYGFENSCDLQVNKIFNVDNGTDFSLIYKDKEYMIKTRLTGKFNVYNMLASLGLIIKIGYKLDDIIEYTLKITPPPGRMEKIEISGVHTFIDYAHTPDALESVLSTMRESYKKIVLVFGCGGNRDKGKRKEMGKIGEKLADYIIITNDNPRNENPENIVKDIIEGIEKKHYNLIYDRTQAIYKAIDIASEKDAAVLIAGKGHENYQEVQGKKNYFSDRETVLNYENNN